MFCEGCDDATTNTKALRLLTDQEPGNQNIEYNQRVLYTEFSEDSCSTEPTFQYVLRVSSFQYVNTFQYVNYYCGR